MRQTPDCSTPRARTCHNCGVEGREQRICTEPFSNFCFIPTNRSSSDDGRRNGQDDNRSGNGNYNGSTIMATTTTRATIMETTTTIQHQQWLMPPYSKQHSCSSGAIMIVRVASFLPENASRRPRWLHFPAGYQPRDNNRQPRNNRQSTCWS